MPDSPSSGTHYHFASKTNIGVLIASGDMLEHAEVHGNIYGTSRAAFEAVSGAGTVCVLDVDTQGVRSLKKAGVQPPPYYVFVKPPSMDAIKTRLEKRGTETADSLATRLATVQSELDFADAGGHFDAVIVNDDLEVAYALLRGLYLEHLAGRPGLSPPPPPPPQDEGAGAGEGGAFAYFDEPGGNVVFAFGGPGSGRESTARKAAEVRQLRHHFWMISQLRHHFSTMPHAYLSSIPTRRISVYLCPCASDAGWCLQTDGVPDHARGSGGRDGVGGARREPADAKGAAAARRYAQLFPPLVH